MVAATRSQRFVMAFAIPKYLLAAPIAKNWREIGQTL
jgi:hypothetical protein